jgi:hypothetical protein
MNITTIIDGIMSNLIWFAVIGAVGLIWRFKYAIKDFILFRYKFKSITGIVNVDETIGDGISPEKALSSCQNNIKFLGIAAHKLVSSPVFNETIQRCHRANEPTQFLLADPANPILQQAARRAGKSIEEYKSMVKNTLERLGVLKHEHGYNIQVRLYKSNTELGPPSFRLFFIDNSSVLVSYYVFGEGDGLQMPQIQILKPNKDRDTKNFYFAFNHYFNSLWETSEDYPLTETES